MVKKAIISVVIILVISLGFYRIGWMLSSGSYPLAEVYELTISESELIGVIKEVKAENPEVNLPHQVRIPNKGTTGLLDGRSTYWYSFYFYYPETKEIIHTWTRSTLEGNSKFAFVAISNGFTLGNWTTANQSFWWWQNKDRKIKFEERILAKINAKIHE